MVPVLDGKLQYDAQVCSFIVNMVKAFFFGKKAVANMLFIFRNDLGFFTRAQRVLSYHLM